MAPGAASDDMFVPTDKSSTEGENKNWPGGCMKDYSMKDEFYESIIERLMTVISRVWTTLTDFKMKTRKNDLALL